MSYKCQIAVWHGGDSVSAYLPDALELAVVLRRFDLDDEMSEIGT